MASPKHRAFRGKVLYGILTAAGALAGRLSLSANQAIGRTLGTFAYYVVRWETPKALRNIGVAFPDWDAARRRRVIKDMFRHLGTSVFETLWLRTSDKAARQAATRFEGFDPVLEHVNAGRAVFVFTLHSGNWEWLSFLIGDSAPNVSVIHRDRNEAGLNQFVIETRALAGVRSIGRGSSGSPREIIQAIRRGGILGCLIDQSVRIDSVLIPFFGRPALTPIGPAKLAIRSESIVVAAYTERRAGVHHIVFFEPRQAQRDEDPVKLTEEMSAVIEAHIRRVPEQWTWIHDRWRYREKWDVGAKTSDPVS